jgi:hypothetical protein
MSNLGVECAAIGDTFRGSAGGSHTGRIGLIDVGPGAGDEGGKVVVAGPPAAVAGTSRSRTGAYLAHFRGGAK